MAQPLLFSFLFFSFFSPFSFFSSSFLWYYYTLKEEASQVLSDCECSIRGLKLKAHFPYTDITVLCSGQYYAMDSDTTILND